MGVLNARSTITQLDKPTFSVPTKAVPTQGSNPQGVGSSPLLSEVPAGGLIPDNVIDDVTPGVGNQGSVGKNKNLGDFLKDVWAKQKVKPKQNNEALASFLASTTQDLGAKVAQQVQNSQNYFR